jgi:formate hydrogenlyase subunit 3/multisubunit Na+/H+ antiporter MnhD subunit
MINILLVFLIISVLIILLLRTKWKGIITLTTVGVISIISGIIALKALTGNTWETNLAGPEMFGNVPVRIDSLSAWFILVINFTFITGAIYGFNYMKEYFDRTNDITLHCIAFILSHSSLIGICSVQNSFIFLLLWEIMALSFFFLVIFEHNDPVTIKAGINFLIQSHISIVLLMLGFVYFSFKTGNYTFDSIAQFSSTQSTLAGTALYLIFFAGFAFKAGFVPFHTWLPYAHPAAPSHVSGVMSGVLIKIGIYGILRMLLLIKVDFTIIGYFILIISVVTGLYGVMLATIQHNLKKLLAYHSIENIGIIGIGIGIGCIGLGNANMWMTILGFSGALLHTLNHSLFKSVLFYGAGNVLQAVHTVNVESLGGLIKRMPRTAILFLIAALAICGLPPLNGFISEFLIYAGIYNWLNSGGVFPMITVIFALTGLVLIGGLAILCFTKAFSIVFLGTQRTEYHDFKEYSFWRLLPMYMAVILMISIGLFPHFFMSVLNSPVSLFTRGISFNQSFIKVGAIDSLQSINWMFLGFIALVLLIAGLRKLVGRNKIIEMGPTWGCGYQASSSKIQYTANSYVRSYAKLAKPVLDIEKHEVEVSEIFPSEKHYETHPYDKIEKVFIDKPLKQLNRFTDLFLFLQNGHLQRYILYGIVFITSVIVIPLLISKIEAILELLKSL